MGGCRCTYRNCTVKSDGSTHMFHYPVFDKIRCHRWLTHAQRLDFLNLKVSQLKNRVVCQNHFCDEYFMNFKKEKLTFDAVPTLDGPYCDSKQFDSTKGTQAANKVYPISLDDIEPEQLSLSDKKANFSVKYGDFLTNFEIMDLDIMNEPSDIKKDVNKSKSYEEVYSQYDGNRNCQQQQIGYVPQNTLQQITIPTMVDIQFEDMQQLQANSINQKISSNNNMMMINQKPVESNGQSWDVPLKQVNSNDMKVKILSEMTLSDPVQVKGKLEPISPSLILRLPDRKNDSIQNSKTEDGIKCEEEVVNINGSMSNTNELASLNNALDSNKVPMEEIKNKPTSTVLQTIPQPQKPLIKRNKNSKIVSNRTLLKSRIKQERDEEIKEKRKFNMKLRDIIESCLNKMDEQEKSNDIVTLKPSCSVENDAKKDQVSSFLSEEPGLPSVQEYTMACLEARIKKMESVLVNKIDLNSQRISELKTTLIKSDKKSSCTQTATNEESHKRHIYKEISKYLSPDANSLIYEELFINKYSQKVPKCPASAKKRRRR